ncbi:MULTISPECIES: winged helix-turn-helix transcriptional regulator [unclassified Streptomyces]|uniref:winged helix-turn-helix transcriptional regulator n=1 Tax=unclassified Streptomyces TaxID=2593676 RepID=UPI0038244F6D
MDQCVNGWPNLVGRVVTVWATKSSFSGLSWRGRPPATWISNRVLSGRLADLENNGLVSRDVVATRPVSITYRLTDHGQQVAGVLSRLRKVAGSPVDT